MSNEEIILKIEELKKQNNEIVISGFFTLNQTITENIKKIEELESILHERGVL